MIITRLGVLMCSSLPLLSYFMESITQLFGSKAASKSHFSIDCEENMMDMRKGGVSNAANVAAQKHFRQIQHMC
ncbi:hypothetical protein TanjilG_32633 [Lupinus angustifolius]|uniref:Uncharacterized protein n=1 Tax=Lupinus angustifolius TaxID=3871 RepID=A0A4P1R862_LUPAN|nr:hypothetical protein TanjilG_32633 [Lupinus angustifolius]